MPQHKDGTPSRLDRLIRRAQWVLAVEGLWPPVILAASVIALFVAVSWLGLWVAVPRPIRILGVAVLLFGLAVAGFAAVRAARPSRARALARLDRDSGLPHRPVSAVEDQLANQSADPTTRALWDLHRKRLDTTLARVRVSRPSPRLPERDPFALRALALLVLVAAGFIAGPDKEGLVSAAFDWRGGHEAGKSFRVDAWVDPPAYTGKPPLVLFAPDQAGQSDRTVTVPTHSVVVVRASGGALEIKTEGALHPIEPEPAANAAATAGAPAPRSPDERAEREASAGPAPKAEANDKRFLLTGRGRIEVGHDGEHLASVSLQVVPDLPPSIALRDQPKPTARGGLTLAYKIDDDYGVMSADASFSEPALNGTPVTGRSIVPPPRLALGLPPGPGGLGNGQTTGDLSEHPWAGAEVTLVLSAKDEGGNIGLSAPVRITLPSRPFRNPLARALVEQRRDLVLDPDHRDRVGIALDALMIAPDEFGTSKSVYLGLRTARDRLEAARNDDDLVSLAGFLWEMALRIEDGDLSQTQRDLRAAEKALRDAMQRGASPEEIKKLTEAMRQQMDKMLAEMMRKGQNGQQQESRNDPNSKTVTDKDLQRMMQQMEDAARAGDTAEAQRLLDQLQTMLDNLKSARRGGSNQASREMNRQMNELDRMTREQQALRDKTFGHGQQNRRSSPGAEGGSPDQPQMGQNDDPDQDGMDENGDQAQSDQPSPDQQQGAGQADQDLQNQQQALRQRLQALEKAMRDLGMKGEKGLDDAEGAMKEAEGALGQGGKGNKRAVDAQGRALQGLQQGANGLAQQMAQGQGEQSGDGQGSGSTGQGMAGGNDTDPLGRPRDGRGTLETRGSEIGEGVAQRAQRVLQELRRRLGDPTRSQTEQDYLERLLNRY